MKGYLIADIEITDPQGYAEYRKIVGESIAAFGGRFLTRVGGVRAKLTAHSMAPAAGGESNSSDEVQTTT